MRYLAVANRTMAQLDDEIRALTTAAANPARHIIAMQIERLLIIAQNKGCTLAQLAVAWLLAHDAVAPVIAGVTRISHVEENAGATQVILTAEELAEIDALGA